MLWKRLLNVMVFGQMDCVSEGEERESGGSGRYIYGPKV
jgi:hypothetical protein